MRVLVVLLLWSVFLLSWSNSVNIQSRRVSGVSVKVITANLNDRRVQVSAATTQRIGRTESIWGLLARSRPTAAVCGTYFCKQTAIPVGDIVVDGQLAHFGGVGTALCITYDNEAKFIRQTRNRHADWLQYKTVIGAGPRLLLNGRVWVYPKAEGFKDPRIYSAAPRTAVGVTKHNKLLIVVTRQPITLSRLAKVMKALGAVNAITLDGGGSTCLYYRKKLIIPPGRRLTNLLVVYEDRSVYEQVKPRLVPANRLARQ